MSGYNSIENDLLTSPQKTKFGRILELDGLRAFAVAFVVIYHIFNWSGVISNINQNVSKFFGILGESGVHIFFVISGFIITSILLKESKKPEGVSLISFYQRRFFRIIPPFAVYLFTLFLLDKSNYITIKPINFLWSSLFLGNLNLFENSHSGSSWFVGHTWSLSVEEQYYLIFPPVMVLILKFKLIPTNIFLIILLSICLMSLKIAKEAALHINPIFIKLTALYSFRYIITGVLFALHKNIIQKNLKNKSILFPIIFILFIFICNYIEHQPMITSIPLSILELFCYGLLIIWFTENPSKCAVLRWKWIQWLGACSYSIYLWQQLFTGEASFYNGRSIAQSPFSIIAILLCAALSYYLVELPSIRIGRIISKKS